MRDLITSYGGEIAGEVYVPMDASAADLHAVLAKVKSERPGVLFSTVVGRSAQNFYRLYREAGFESGLMPIASLTMAEGEVQEIGAELCEGRITAAAYFGSVNRARKKRFAADFSRAFGAG